MYERALLQEGSPNETTALNAQAVLDLTLIGTKLKMAFTKIENKNTFIILPIDKDPGKGMKIGEMIDEINALLKSYDPMMPDSGLTVASIADPIQEVNEAANTKSTKSEGSANIDYKTINIALRQAFLLITTGEKVEFAIEIDVDLSGLFPAGQSFVNVGKLTLAVWNTKRAHILDRMNIVEISKLLEQPL